MWEAKQGSWSTQEISNSRKLCLPIRLERQWEWCCGVGGVTRTQEPGSPLGNENHSRGMVKSWVPEETQPLLGELPEAEQEAEIPWFLPNIWLLSSCPPASCQYLPLVETMWNPDDNGSLNMYYSSLEEEQKMDLRVKDSWLAQFLYKNKLI